MKLFFTIITIFVITSCSIGLEEKKTIRSGGITTSFTVSHENVNFEKNLRSRLDFLKHRESFEYDLSKEKNIYTIKLPFILSKSQINSLLFSRGEIFIKKGDSINFDSKSFEKNETVYKVPFEGVSLFFKDEYKVIFEKFTIKNKNQHIKIYLDTTLIMSPKIAGTIADGKLIIKSLESKAFNSDIIYVTFNYPYENEVFENVDQKVFLKDGNQLEEIPEKYYNIYNQLKYFVAAKGLTIIQSNTNLNSEDELKISSEISMIIYNDFYGYLVGSNVKSFSDLNETFFLFQGYLNKYNYHDLNKQIYSLKH
jgi:hypothetical protein